ERLGGEVVDPDGPAAAVDVGLVGVLGARGPAEGDGAGAARALHGDPLIPKAALNPPSLRWGLATIPSYTASPSAPFFLACSTSWSKVGPSGLPYFSWSRLRRSSTSLATAIMARAVSRATWRTSNARRARSSATRPCFFHSSLDGPIVATTW